MFDNLYTIKHGWAVCHLCSHHLKGADEAATERIIREHLFRVHDKSLPSDESPSVPYYIPPDRNGLSPVQVKRFDHSSNMRSEKQQFKGI